MPEPLADSARGLVALLEWDEPLAIGFYPDQSEKALLVENARALAAPREVHVVHSGEEALALVDHDALIILDPEDPRAAVEFLDHNRDHFEGVKARLLLLLLSGGSGERALADAPQLSSFARSAGFEVAREPAAADAAADFVVAHGVDHHEWLRRWRSGELHDTLENNLVLGEALAIDGEP